MRDRIGVLVLVLVLIYVIGLIVAVIVLGIRESFRFKKTRKHEEEELSPDQHY